MHKKRPASAPIPATVKQWLLTVTAVFSALACPPQQVHGADRPGSNDTAADPAQTYVFECENGFEFSARLSETRAWLFLPREALQLPRTDASGGTRYRGRHTTFWHQGEDAMLERENASYLGCKNNPAKAIWEHAKLNGVDLRATGNEPGWQLELTLSKDMVFSTDYGHSSYRFKTPQADIDRQARKTTYRAGNSKHKFSASLKEKDCRDSMSGKLFEVTVSIELDGRQFRGCGRALH